MRKILKDDFHFDFLGKRRLSLGGSAAVIVAGLVAVIALGGLNYGIDFSGGTIVQVQLRESHEIGEIREVLSSGDIGAFSLQAFGDESENEFLVTVGGSKVTHIGKEAGIAQKVKKVLKVAFPEMVVRRVESVGPRVGEELRLAAAQAILFSLVAILVYVWLRFQWRYSIGAITALVHDVLIVLAAFVVTQKEITLPVVAAVLTVAGYSINDTIVIFDRIRENFRRYQKKSAVDVINESLSQTLNRTLLTSGTTLFVLMSIFLFGGEIINDFAFALVIGVVVGTYSSVFIAAPVLLFLREFFPTKAR